MAGTVDWATTKRAQGPSLGHHFESMLAQRTHLRPSGNKAHAGHFIVIRVNHRTLFVYDERLGNQPDGIFTLVIADHQLADAEGWFKRLIGKQHLFGARSLRKIGVLAFQLFQKLQDAHGATQGEEIWRDLNFLNDPLAPVSVPDPTTPGFGGPLAQLETPAEVMLACVPRDAAPSPVMLASAGRRRAPKDEALRLASAGRWPDRDYTAGAEKRDEILAQRAELAKRLGAWPMLGSYSWVIAANKSATSRRISAD